MQRKIETANVLIQLENPHVPLQMAAPVIMTQTSTIVNDKNVAVYQATQRVEPMTPTDFSDGLIAQMNVQLKDLGVEIVRIEAKA